jgi:excisionase family DNA binding protein
MKELESKESYNLEEAAQFLGMKLRALKDACLAKRIRYAKLDRRTWRFARADLNDFINRNTIEPRTPYGPKKKRIARLHNA